MPIFYRNILEFFKELKIMYRYDQGSDLVLFNNKEIFVDNKSVYLNKWVEKGISIKDLLNDHGSYPSLKELSDKIACKTNFLQYYQIISTIPNQLLLKARQKILSTKNSLQAMTTVFILTTISELTWTKQNHATSTNCSLINPYCKTQRSKKME